MTSVCTEYAYACSYSYEYSVRVFVLYSYYTYAGWGFARRRPRPSRARPMLSSHQRITRRDEQQRSGPARDPLPGRPTTSELVCVPTTLF